MKRRFNSKERVALYLAADGHCTSCGVELGPGWHADHVHPYSRGGTTDVVNGAALCPSCNHKKGSSVTDPRTQWQNDAHDAFMASSRRDFLITACPGSGKTRCALGIARSMKDAGQIQRVIVVAPTGRVQEQWRRAAHQFGLDLTSQYAEALPADCDGAVITYQRLAGNELLYRRHAGRVPTLLIADEVHHCSDAENRRWGAALQQAFDPVVRRLLLSGTPFRSDGVPIPFVEYDGNGMAISQTSIGYGEAVADGVCRPVRFEVMDGAGVWARGGTRFQSTASDATEDQRSGLLSALYQSKGKWIASMFAAADGELTRMREEKPTAGGLVLAQDITTAKAYADLLARTCGQHVPVVTSDGADGSVTIDRFRDGDSRWIVAVAMIAEGVDIPRLSVLVFASRVMTEMWFRQVVGRITRQDGDPITATMLIPAVPGLVEMAGRVEGEAVAGLRDAENRLRDRMDSEQREFDQITTVPIASGAAERSSVIASGSEVTPAELSIAEQLRERTGGSMTQVHVADLARAMRLYSGSIPVATTHVTVPPVESTGDDLRANLRLQVNRAVNRCARDTGRQHSHIHRDLNDRFGATLPTASVVQLEKRLEALRLWQ